MCYFGKTKVLFGSSLDLLENNSFFENTMGIFERTISIITPFKNFINESNLPY